MNEVRFDPVIVSFALAAGSSPVWRRDPRRFSGSRAASSARRSARPAAVASWRPQSRLRRLLVCAEVALTLTVLIGAALLVKTLLRLESVDPAPAAGRVSYEQTEFPICASLSEMRYLSSRPIGALLYDIWVALYGKDFADRNVIVESARKGIHDYDSAWKWALALGAEERAARFKMLRR
jgi:hypothetical protein